MTAGAFAFFNFSYGAGSVPSPEALNKFLDPSVMEWPLAKMQGHEETVPAFHERYVSKIDQTRNLAIGLAGLAAVLFFIGVLSVLTAI